MCKQNIRIRAEVYDDIETSLPNLNFQYPHLLIGYMLPNGDVQGIIPKNYKSLLSQGEIVMNANSNPKIYTGFNFNNLDYICARDYYPKGVRDLTWLPEQSVGTYYFFAELINET